MQTSQGRLEGRQLSLCLYSTPSYTQSVNIPAGHTEYVNQHKAKHKTIMKEGLQFIHKQE